MSKKVKIKFRKVQKDVKDIVGTEYSLVKVSANTNSVTLRHSICGHCFITSLDKLRNGQRCNFCQKENLSEKTTQPKDHVADLNLKEKATKLNSKTQASENGLPARTNDFMELVNELRARKFTIVDNTYINNDSPLKIKHEKCGKVFTIIPHNFLSNPKCKVCEEEKNIERKENVSPKVNAVVTTNSKAKNTKVALKNIIILLEDINKKDDRIFLDDIAKNIHEPVETLNILSSTGSLEEFENVNENVNLSGIEEKLRNYDSILADYSVYSSDDLKQMIRNYLEELGTTAHFASLLFGFKSARLSTILNSHGKKNRMALLQFYDLLKAVKGENVRKEKFNPQGIFDYVASEIKDNTNKRGYIKNLATNARLQAESETDSGDMQEVKEQNFKVIDLLETLNRTDIHNATILQRLETYTKSEALKGFDKNSDNKNTEQLVEIRKYLKKLDLEISNASKSVENQSKASDLKAKKLSLYEKMLNNENLPTEILDKIVTDMSKMS